MHYKGRKARNKFTFGIILTEQLRKEIETLAESEARSLSSTIRVLLREALAMRSKRQEVKRAAITKLMG